MKPVEELQLGFSDASNYTRRQNKEMFNNVFVRNKFLDGLLSQQIYFLIGEKGTGKTAYSTYLKNNNYKGVKADTSFIGATDYEKFYKLKQNSNISISGYTEIWKVILLVIISKNIKKEDIVEKFWNANDSFKKLMQAIDEYYMHAFSPEISHVLNFIDESREMAQVIFKYANLGGENSKKIEFKETRIQQNLYYIEKQFTDIFSILKLKRDMLLFIDGIDIRPDSMPYADYIECIKGLTTASWELNTTIFSDVRDTKGHLRIILLLRPDIYNSLNLQNATNKLLDNSIFLDWRTTYTEYKQSSLYKVVQNLLLYNQCDVNLNEDVFEYYFPWHKPSTNINNREEDTAFIEFLKISLSRPRDMQVIMSFLQRKMKSDRLSCNSHFNYRAFKSDDFQNNYSEYFMSSLKDQLSFYYSSTDFEHFLKLFSYFSSTTFSFKNYERIFNDFNSYIKLNTDQVPEFLDDQMKLLQLLYDCNIIAAIEMKDGKKYFNFSYREKSNSNINPKVPVQENVEYRFHFGLYKKTKKGRY